MTFTGRERILAFIVGVILCSALSSSIGLIAREHNELLSGTPAPSQEVSKITHVKPHVDGNHSDISGVGSSSIWAWAHGPLHKAEDANGTTFSVAMAYLSKLGSLTAGKFASIKGSSLRDKRIPKFDELKRMTTRGAEPRTSSTAESVRMPENAGKVPTRGLWASGGSTMLLACLVGVTGCIIIVLGVMNVLWSPSHAILREVSDEELPITATEVNSQNDGEPDSDEPPTAKNTKSNSKTRETVEGLVRNVLDEIAPEEAV